MGLEADYKTIFLDVACFWKGEKKDEAINALQSCQLRAITGLKVLERKSFITVSIFGTLEMHDSIQEMGWDIVRRDHRDEPERHSRLWIREEIERILANDLENESTRGIKLIGWELYPSAIMKGLKKMKKLRFLYVDTYSFFDFSGEFDEANGYLPNTLQYLLWHHYPLSSLPIATFQESNLSGLCMHYSRLVRLSQGGKNKVLKKLKFFDVRGSYLKTFNLGFCPNLETLSIDCNSLKKLHMPTKCPKLKSLAIYGESRHCLGKIQMPAECTKLESLKIEHPSLQHLVLRYAKLKTLSLGMILYPESITLHDLGPALNLENLILEECSLLKKIMIHSCSELITLDLGRSPNLEDLHLEYCSNLVQVGMHVGYPRLRFLTLRRLPMLRTLDTAMTPNLEKLDTEGCNQLELQIPLKCSKLKTFELSGSMQKTLRLQTPNLEDLRLERCSYLLELHMLDECPKLKTLFLCCETLKTLKLKTPNIEKLRLKECWNLLELHMLDECPKLKILSISCSKLRTFNLAQTPNLDELSLEECNQLELQMPLKCSKLKSFNLRGSMQKTLRLQTPNLENLWLAECSNLLELHMLDECTKLENLSISHSKLRTFNLAQTPNIKDLILWECYTLEELHAPIACLGKICRLCLSGCSRFKTFEFPNKFEDSEVDAFPELKVIVESMDTSNNYFPKFRFECYYDERPLLTGNLEKLISVISTCQNLESFYESVCDLQYLRKLELIGNIPEFPNDLCWSGHLEELTISSKDIKHLPDSICMLKQLKYLKLESCWHLEKLPHDLGELECLETLSLSDCRYLGDIPKRICQIKCLKYLHLSYCLSLKELPEELGHLASLKELRVEGPGVISQLPQSIFRLQGLSIIGCDQLLRSWGLAPQKKISEFLSKCCI